MKRRLKNCRQFVKMILGNFYAALTGMGIFMIWEELQPFPFDQSRPSTPRQHLIPHHLEFRGARELIDLTAG